MISNPTVDEMLGQLQSSIFQHSRHSLTEAEYQSPTEAPDSNELRSSAELLILAGDVGLARNILRTMVKNGTLVGWALRTLGRTYENENRPELARRCYQDAIAYEPHLEAYRFLASLEIRSRNDLAAADALERALNIPSLSAKLRIELHKACGNCWMRSQKNERAESHYRKALQLDPSNDAIASNLGALYLQSGRIKDAQKTFEDAVTANPGNAKALAGLGSANLAEGRKREAHDSFARSLELELLQPTVIYHLVKCAYEIKSYATAARLLGRYVESSPINANLLYSLGGLQFHLGRIDEASTTVTRILKMQPTHSGASELYKLIQRYSNATKEGSRHE